MTWLALLVAVAQFAGSFDLLGLGAAPAGSGLPPDWKVRLVRGQAAPTTEVVREDGASVFRMSGAGRAA